MNARMLLLTLVVLSCGSFGCDDPAKTVDSCGDGFIDPAEECDGANLQAQTCESLGHYNLAGTLRCTATCEYDRADCGGRCGDGVIEGERGEQCEGENLAGATCESQGFAGGSLNCDAACHFDTSTCESRCGDGVVTAPHEDCEGNDLAGGTCQTEGFYTGTLRCGADCHYDTTDCDERCGDGVIQSLHGEVCDGLLLDGETCQGLGYYGGDLLCAADCRSLDLSPCEAVGRCGDGLVQSDHDETCDGANLGGQDCQSLGFDRGTLTCRATCLFDQSACILHFSRLVPGGYHTCAFRSNGSIWCWGGNNKGQLGLGNTTARSTPQPLTTLASGVTALAAGELHTCALKTDGSVWCWGENEFGQLGDGTLTQRNAPTAVDALSSDVTALAAGYKFTCALKTDGSAWCWGLNSSGQLGDGTTVNRSVPTAVSGLSSGVTAMAGGWTHACALKADGSVWCWGVNAHGQVGDGTQTQRLIPVAVNGLGSGVASLSAGSEFNCVRKTDGSVWCWGRGDGGQLGNTPTNDSWVPLAVTGLDSVAVVTVGYSHACVLKNDDSVWCWGNNQFGQLGDGTVTLRTTPTAVSGLGPGVSLLSAGAWHACATMNDGSAWCWGQNANGQLGDNSTTLRLTPVQVRF